MKLKSNKVKGKNLTKFLIAVTVLAGGIFSIQYIVNAVSITSITPNTGSVVGGQEVTITGDFTFTPTAMQQVSADYCTNEMSVFPTADSKPDTVTLTDVRNGQDYRVRKLADGKCWMIDNLKLELTDGMILTPQDTNVTTATTVNLADSGRDGNFTISGRNTIDNGTASTPPNFDAWRQNDPTDAADCLNNTGADFNGGKTYNSASITKCGYLYNFYTATAGTAPYTQTSGAASGSICPAGWRLPTGLDPSGDFGTLDVAYGGDGGRNSGPQIATLWLPDGAWEGAISKYYLNNISATSTQGYYWSSSATSDINASHMFFDGKTVRPSEPGSGRVGGFAVRCIVDENHTPTPVTPTVTFGGAPATVLNYSDTSITVLTPNHLAGKVDVVVTRASHTFTLPNAYEYFNIPDVPNTGVSKTSTTTTAVQSGLTALIIITIGTVTFAIIKHRKVKQR